MYCQRACMLASFVFRFYFACVDMYAREKGGFIDQRDVCEQGSKAGSILRAREHRYDRA